MRLLAVYQQQLFLSCDHKQRVSGKLLAFCWGACTLGAYTCMAVTFFVSLPAAPNYLHLACVGQNGTLWPTSVPWARRATVASGMLVKLANTYKS